MMPARRASSPGSVRLVLDGAVSAGAGPRRARVVVLASGSGSTLQAILDAADDATYPALVVAAGTDVKGCRAMERAEARGVATFAVQLPDFADRDTWNDALADQIAVFEPDLVVLAGFMRVLAPKVVRRFRIVNTHPAYLPAFPGAHAVRDALAAGVDTTGVTVHWVDEGVDTGPVIVAQTVPVLPGDDESSLRERIQAAEKPLYVNAIRQICQELSA
ncbi:MAG: phosphoribosylglycinamide formyltransferase 1 [Pseudonocardiales bacterium]|nr:phosphoribosylglycinamide formyltransferase 1 [Pseudonocardiales bacterium]